MEILAEFKKFVPDLSGWQEMLYLFEKLFKSAKTNRKQLKKRRS